MRIITITNYILLLLLGLFIANIAFADTSESTREQRPFFVAGQASVWSGPNPAMVSIGLA